MSLTYYVCSFTWKLKNLFSVRPGMALIYLSINFNLSVYLYISFNLYIYLYISMYLSYEISISPSYQFQTFYKTYEFQLIYPINVYLSISSNLSNPSISIYLSVNLWQYGPSKVNDNIFVLEIESQVSITVRFIILIYV